MAQILENPNGRRSVRLTPDDVISVVREYQMLTCGLKSYSLIREKLKNFEFYLPEE